MKTSRRGFLKLTGFAGGGLVLGVSLTGCSSDPAISSVDGEFTPNAFLQITPDNQVIFYCPRDEMGQGVTTGLTTLIAEDLDVQPQNIDVRFAGAHADYKNPEFGVQATGGSTSIRVHYEQLRQVGADARSLLLTAASQQLEVALDELSTSNGTIVHGDNSYPFGQFASIASELELAEPAALKDRSEFKVIGKEFARLDAQAKSTGTAVYGMDAEVPGLHHAVVKRCPVAGGKLSSFDAERVL